MIALASTLFLLSCATSPAPQARVTVDLFSGRSDAPTWLLSSAETDAFTTQLSALPPTQTTALPPTVLGYRSFVVDLVQADTGERQRIRAYHGVVSREASRGTSYYADPQRTIEHWLLATGRPYLDPPLYQVIATAVQPSPP
jgi:hypothetical protein